MVFRHRVAMKNELAQQNSGIIQVVFKAYSQARQVAYNYLAKQTLSTTS